MLNLDALKSAHGSFIQQHRRMAAHEAEDAAKHIEAQVYQSPKFKPRTGRLQAGTKGSVKAGISSLEVFGRNRVLYAAAIDLGSRPHVIRAKRTRFLRFMWRGKLRFFRQVNHPGTRPYRFLYRAVTSAARIAHQGLTSGMSQIARTF